MSELSHFRLCYIEDRKAYFTTDLKNQWGDDWNDAPYEHNAGTPYPWRASDEKRGVKPYCIMALFFDGEVHTPAQRACFAHEGVSVEDINEGHIPWLQTCAWSDGETLKLFAGATVQEFVDFIYRHDGGEVYFPLRGF